MLSNIYPFFVYGTLRAGGSNHWVLEPFVTQAQEAVLSSFVMYSFGTYPMIFAGEGQVLGEVYLIAPHNYEKAKQRLDQLEGHPHFYQRILQPVQLVNNTRITAWVYVASSERTPDNKSLIISGDWFNRKM